MNPRRVDVLREEVPDTGECVLLDKDGGRILALNPTAAAVWDLIDGSRDVSAIAAVLAEATGIEPDRAEEDVRTFLERLAGEGLLQKP